MQVTCPIAQRCGGCSQIQIPYAQQLQVKQQRIEELFAPLLDGAGGNACVQPILGMDDPRRFRTKIVSPFAPSKKKPGIRAMARTGRTGRVALRQADILTGLYAAGTHRIVRCDDCPVEHEVGRRVVAAVRQIMARYGMAPYDEDAGTGLVRHVMVRVGQQTGEVLVTLVTNAAEFTGSKNFCRELVRRVPEVTTIVQNVNTASTNVILGQRERTLYGPGFILDTLCGLSFRISSHSFYQVNAVQTEVLYRTAVDLAFGPGHGVSPLRHSERSEESPPPAAADNLSAPVIGGEGQAPVILDAYCGTGTIGLVAAAANPQARVIGVDNVEAAIADARQNAAHNGIANATFVARDAGAFMHELAAEGTKVDVLFMDPPRAGTSEQFLQAAAACAPERIVYISCNPTTQVRDCQVLLDSGYHIEHVQPVDMFPHTNHVETVVLMSRKDIRPSKVPYFRAFGRFCG